MYNPLVTKVIKTWQLLVMYIKPYVYIINLYPQDVY